MSVVLIVLFLQNFFVTVLVLIVIFYLIKIVARIALTSFIKRAQENVMQQHREANPRREGEVTIETKGKSKSGNDKSVGEYVDFEEID